MLLAYGVVFVLLIGEIDLSISYISGVAGVVVAQLQLPGARTSSHGLIAILAALLAGIAIGAFQGSIIALIGVPSFVVTLAGFEIWQGVVLKSIPRGRHRRSRTRRSTTSPSTSSRTRRAGSSPRS